MWLSYNDKYEVSVHGEVRTTATKYIKSPSLSHDGYLVVSLGKHRSPRTVHRMVAERWLPAPTEEDLEVDHIDRNRLNNHASNLRWVSHKMNCQNKNIYKSNTTGHKYIIQTSSGFRVQIKGQLYKRVKTLEEAIKIKDDFTSSLP